VRGAGPRGKSNEITARESGPALAMGSSDIFRIALLQTAAASRMTAHTALHAPQAHAAKPDEASPFSILLEQVAPKADKTKPKDKDASDDDAKDTKTDTVKADSKTDAKADAPISQVDKSDKADKADKAEKSDKPEDTAKAAETEATDATQVAADAPAQPPAMPPVPVAATPAPIAAAATPAPGETNNDIEAVNGAANTAPAPQANTTDKTGKTAAAPQDDNQTDDSAADTAATDAAATQDTPQDIKGAAKPAPRKPVQVAADTKPGKPDAIKATSTQSNSIKSDSTKTDGAKPDAPQPDKVAAADAPVPKPVPPVSTNLAVHDITAPQAPQTNVPGAQSVTQHVQVAQQTPAPAPNLPALAIEISAKSQSGAKQFDIRLDPPELGRVEVRLSIDAAGKASAHLSADQPQTLDLLQKDSTSLMRALRDAGLNVSQDGLNFSLRQQNHQDSGAHQGGGRGTPRNFTLTATTSTEATATSAAYRRPADGRIDISV
jgi:flagellar hook-length control protein FliK